MRDPNARVRPRERTELSLDGRQIASIVVGALVILAVVFVLGLNVGKQIATRQAEAARAGDLDALDRAPAPVPAVKEDALTFHDRLTKETPPALPPAPRTDSPAPPSSPPPAPKQDSPAPPPSPPPVPAPDSVREAARAEPPPPAAEPPAPAKPWTIQLAAAQDRAEAERLASRFARLNPRIEEADVPGKGLFYRVRVGGFDSKDAAERYLRDVARETGAKGFVTASR